SLLLCRRYRRTTQFTRILANFLVEAQSFGRPVISFDVGGNRECFQNQVSGLLVHNEGEMLAAIQQLAADADLRCSMSQAAITFAQQEFSTQQQGKHYLRVLREVA